MAVALDHPASQSMKAIDLLGYAPTSQKVNPRRSPTRAEKRAHKLADQAGIVNGKLVGELTERQREALVKSA